MVLRESCFPDSRVPLMSESAASACGFHEY